MRAETLPSLIGTMNDLRNNLLCVVAGLLAVAAGLWGVAGEYSRALAVLGGLLAVLYFPFACRAWTSMLATRRELAELGKPARMALQMPYHEISSRVQALARVDAGVLVSPGYCSWKSPAYGRISIAHGDGDAWKALFWLNDAAEQQELHGLALYRRGELSVYPASAQAHFAEVYMENLLHSSRDAFNQWLSAHGSASRR